MPYQLINIASPEHEDIYKTYQTIWIEHVKEPHNSTIIQPDSTDTTAPHSIGHFIKEATGNSSIDLAINLYVVDNQLNKYLIAIYKKV